MAPRTDSLLTLDLMLEAVPYSSANILETRDIWSPTIFYVPVIWIYEQFNCYTWRDIEGDHAGSIAPRSLQRFNKFLHFPDLHIFVSMFWSFTHCGESIGSQGGG